MNVRDAVSCINRKGMLLVYPIQNRPEPASLWSEFFPRAKMKWEWDDGADNRVAKIWHLREEVSRSGKVVYAKWFQGRATFFSRPVFTAALSILAPREGLFSPEARRILHLLEEDSPLSTKQLKARAGMTGQRSSEFERCLKQLWQSLQIVGYGEIEDGAFPSLAIGATSLMFDKLHSEARILDVASAEKTLISKLGEDSVFYRYLRKLRPTPADPPPAKMPKVIRYEDL